MAVSLSGDTKDALAREIPAEAHCRQALLAGLSLYGRSAHGTAFATQRNAVARLFRAISPGAPHIEKVPGTRLRRVPSYRIPLPEPLDIKPAKPARRCDRIMELRAAFLACGSLSAARGYHLEFVAAGEPAGERLAWMLRSTATAPKSTHRKGHRVLYYKDFEAIVELLTIVGAHGAVLRLEDLRALKETKNRIHRLVNMEAANLERSGAAAAAARETVTFLSSAYGLQNLSPPLREIAELRLAYPDESLAELGRRCNPAIAKPTVSGRFLSLERIARRLRGETSKTARKN